MITSYAVKAAIKPALLRSYRSDGVRTYRAAVRHSRRVRWLRITLPIGMAIALLTVAAANYLPTFTGLRLPGELGKLVIKGTKITMQQPRLAGFTSDSRPYEFTAVSAAQEMTRLDLMELQRPHGRIAMEDKSTVEISANSGAYDLKAEKLTLADQVRLVSSVGYEVRLSEVVVDVREGSVLSEKPVWVKLLDGSVSANRLEVVEQGSLVRFGDGVMMILQPTKHPAEAAER